MTTVYDVEANLLIKEAAEDLKKRIKAPEWAPFVKTGVSKERVPDDPDWWYVRGASILRKLYLKGPMGVSRLRSEYRSRKNRGVKPEKSYKASGKIIRLALQQLEELGYVKKAKGRNQGREITPEGVKYLDNMAHRVKNGRAG